MLCMQESVSEVQGLQQKLTEAEEAHEEELVDMQATVQSCSTKLQDTKVPSTDSQMHLLPCQLFSWPQ